jgi:hypothetical protein
MSLTQEWSDVSQLHDSASSSSSTRSIVDMVGSESTSESPAASTSKKGDTSTEFFTLSISLSKMGGRKR